MAGRRDRTSQWRSLGSRRAWSLPAQDWVVTGREIEEDGDAVDLLLASDAWGSW
jgi:hypothetical protein